eukprot:11118116-Ditylum_brightwellii.AAC.1
MSDRKQESRVLTQAADMGTLQGRQDILVEGNVASFMEMITQHQRGERPDLLFQPPPLFVADLDPFPALPQDKVFDSGDEFDKIL